jgi:hypothetical protein
MEWIDIYFWASAILFFVTGSYITINIIARVAARIALKQIKKETHG